MTGSLRVGSRFVREDAAQDIIEYALLATFVSLIGIAGAALLGTALNNWFSQVSDNVNTSAAKVM